MAKSRTQALAAELEDARRRFFAAVERIAPERRGAPGLVEEWSVQQLIAHVGYWAGHATEQIHAAESGRAPEPGLGRAEVDARNATVAAVAAGAGYATVARREAGSFQALSNRLRAMDPTLLDLPVPGSGTLERALREDGPDHYAEHAAQLEVLQPGTDARG